MTCSFAHDDGAYVLGSLSAADRRAFEEHLQGCPACARAVSEIAGLPGLLSRVSPDVLDEDIAVPPLDEPPASVLPRLLMEVRRQRRRRTWTALAAAAAAVLAVAGGTWAVVAAQDDAGPAPAQAMTRTGDVPMVAELSLTTVPWGTRLDLSCSYPTGHRYLHEPWTMVLVVHTAEGTTERVATWHARSGQDMQLTAATALSVDDITSVEVRTAGGAPVMRLTG